MRFFDIFNGLIMRLIQDGIFHLSTIWFPDRFAAFIFVGMFSFSLLGSLTARTVEALRSIPSDVLQSALEKTKQEVLMAGRR
jgi:hypothetical protein